MKKAAAVFGREHHIQIVVTGGPSSKWLPNVILATGFGPSAAVNFGPLSAVKWTASVFWQGDGLRAEA